jgi:small subunit ribosomal protein S13
LARIAGVDLPRNKRTEIALTYIFGVGRSAAREICKRTGVDREAKLKDLTEDEVRLLRTVIENQFKVEGDLRREISLNLKRLIDIGSYRGQRHIRKLPCRGQRTHTNARTRRGKKRVAVGKKKKK